MKRKHEWRLKDLNEFEDEGESYYCIHCLAIAEIDDNNTITIVTRNVTNK